MQDSPFKFLDAYQKEEKDIFFGREQETEILYQMTFDTNLILVYGASGTGKTSLVQAGLANKFSPTRWKDIFIRRNDNLNRSLETVLNEELDKARGKKPDEHFPPMEAIEKLHRRTLTPLYLIFDQFEELFILSQEKGEEEKFFHFIQQVLATNIPCKILLVMREEYLANLWPFEQRLPSLFNYRFRVERMRESQLKEVIQKTLARFEEKGAIAVEQGKLEPIADSIFNKLAGKEKKSEIELTYLQVYLDRLYQEAGKQTKSGPPLFTLALAESMGEEDVMEYFLRERTDEIQKTVFQKDGSEVKSVLDVFVTEEGTKRPVAYTRKEEDIEILEENVKNQLAVLSPDRLTACLAALEKGRLLRFQSDTIELAHDTLAALIEEQRTDEQRVLNKMRQEISSSYDVSQRTEDFHLTPGQLEYYRPYLDELHLADEHRKLIEDSERFHEEEAIRKEQELIEERRLREEAQRNKKKADRLAALASVVALVAVVFAVGAFIFFQRAEKEKQAAQKSLIKSFKSDIKRYDARIELAKQNIISFDELDADPDVTELDRQKIINLTDSIKALRDTIVSIGFSPDAGTGGNK